MKQGAPHITTQSPQGTIFGLHVGVEGLPPTRIRDHVRYTTFRAKSLLRENITET